MPARRGHNGASTRRTLVRDVGIIERAILAVRRGNADEAIAVVRESLTHIRELQDKFVFVYALVPLAAAAALKGDDEWAARILGARDAVTDRTGATVVDQTVHDLREQAEREVRARLGPDRWGLAYAAGRSASIDSLIKDIDSVLKSHARTERPEFACNDPRVRESLKGCATTVGLRAHARRTAVRPDVLP